MRNSNYFLLVGIILTSFLFQSCKKENTSVGPTEETSIGELTIMPDGILTGTDNKLTIKLSVPPAVSLSDSAVIYKVDQNGQQIKRIGVLLDNGLLINGDEILGDNIFSGIIVLHEAGSGTVYLKAFARLKSGSDQSSGTVTLTVYSDLTGEEFNAVDITQENAKQQLLQNLQGSADNIRNAVDATVNWLKTQSTVESVANDGTTSILIKYKNGLYGGVIISVADDFGEIDTKGGFIPDTSRNKIKALPLKKQTTGGIGLYSKALTKAQINYADLDPKLIGNRNVLIYAPFEAAFKKDMRPSIEAILNSSEFQFNITASVNQEANINVLENITQYGLIIFDTHGAEGKELSTGEIADTLNDSYKTKYKIMLKAGKLAIWENMVISKSAALVKSENVYAVRYPFFSGLPGKFPNSVVYNGSCESSMTDSLYEAFKSSGVKTYYGFNKVVNTTFCSERADSVVKRLANDLKNTGEAFISGTDPVAPNATFELKGENDIRYPDDLINGDFEFGKLDGWTKDGDGRVISKLGTQNPAGGFYMGIISTGLGFTTATGKIFQTFTVKNTESTLTIKWNFLSEEFLEFIGSQYQDYFRVIIKTKDGVETELIDKTIDGIASDFGASHPDDSTFIAGNLIDVSPGISFDRGGVYMTGWQTSTFDVSAYRGKRITLTILAGDVGDSIYDTAIILDDISIK
ncbi:MAG TPA: choice-of-anchor L domain-containing protein [Ignavibacteriaceae bacterium]|nr:choice-of-anchor L domain-containing protein [Ignavibacteriaceae bacterium]